MNTCVKAVMEVSSFKAVPIFLTVVKKEMKMSISPDEARALSEKGVKEKAKRKQEDDLEQEKQRKLRKRKIRREAKKYYQTESEPEIKEAASAGRRCTDVHYKGKGYERFLDTLEDARNASEMFRELAERQGYSVENGYGYDAFFKQHYAWARISW